ncbi:MAG: ferritin-like domain-containing protein, partial [Myxococcota bacterium]
MARMIPSKNDLPEATRQKVSQLLNEQVAGAIHLQLLAKQAHWNVRGPNFRSLHKLFDAVFEAATVWADSLAERTAQLGWTVDSTLELIVDRTNL